MMTERTAASWCRPMLAAILALAVVFGVGAEDDWNPDEQEALRQGREIAALALGEDAATLWPRLGTQLQGLVGAAEGLERISAQIRAELGPEQTVLDEQIKVSGNGFYYRRVARHAANQPPLAVEIQVVDDRIEGLRFAPAPDAETASPPAAETGPGELPDSAWIRARIDAEIAGAAGFPSIIVGVLDTNGRRFIAAGDAGDGRPPDPDTVFEAGSITKGLTGLLLAQMIAAGDVRADQTIGSLFPDDVSLSPVLASITLEELASHQSGLPRLSAGAAMTSRLHSDDPYAGSTLAEVLADTAAVADTDIESGRGRYGYSNLGSALLGQLLSRAAGRPYEQLVVERVFETLALGPATFGADDVQGRAAVGTSKGQTAKSWRLDAYAPAGAWRSSAAQLLDLAERLLAAEPAWVGEALQRRSGGAERDVGLAWHHGRVGSRDILWHNGATAGFASILAIVPNEGLAVVVLANGSGSVDALATAVLASAN